MAKQSKSIHKPRPDGERRLRQADRVARVWRVLQAILGRGRRNAREIADELEVSERTVYRDLQVLELAGVPWSYDKETKSYQVRPGWQYPVLQLTEEEMLGQVAATVVARSPNLRIGAGPDATTRKLVATLTNDAKQRLEDAEQMIAVLDLKLADHTQSQETIHTIQWALMERKQVTGRYESPYRGRAKSLTLHPYRLCLVQRAWYLIAKPHNEDSPKTYRVQRFKSLRRVDQAAEVPPEFDLQRYFGNAWGVFREGQSHKIELLFAKEAAPFVLETTWHSTQRVKRHADGRVTLTFEVDGLEEILRWLLGWSCVVTVVKPDELRQGLVERLQQAMALNAAGPGDG